MHAGELTPAALKELGVQCVVCTETPRARLVELNEFCRSQSPPVAFLSAETFGLAGAVFSDFGPESAAQTLGRGVSAGKGKMSVMHRAPRQSR